ncbi:MAG: hypothetical protein ACYTEI_08880, partial [Planctomycetota bacterium]
MWTWGAVAVAAFGLGAEPSATGQPRGDEEQRLVEILEGLEHGLVALERLDLREQHEQLELVADDVRGEIRQYRRRGGRDRGAQGPDASWEQLARLAEQFQELLGVTRDELANVEGEIDQLTRDNEVTRQVISKITQDLPGLKETGNRQGSARVGRTLADYERRLEGNRQRLETLKGQWARLSKMLERLEAAYPDVESRLGQAQRRHDGRAREERITKLNRHVLETLEQYRQWRGETPAPRRAELQIVEGQVGALQLALPALRETERRDAIELVERAIAARKTSLEGRRDEEARRIRERAPGREHLSGVRHGGPGGEAQPHDRGALASTAAPPPAGASGAQRGGNPRRRGHEDGREGPQGGGTPRFGRASSPRHPGPRGPARRTKGSGSGPDPRAGPDPGAA